MALKTLPTAEESLPMETLWSDIRFALRNLKHFKVWAAVIILSLGVGIGANTLMFSLVNGLLLRTLNVSEPRSLVRLRWTGPADFTRVNEEGNNFTNAATGHPLRTGFSRVIFDALKSNRQ